MTVPDVPPALDMIRALDFPQTVDWPIFVTVMEKETFERSVSERLRVQQLLENSERVVDVAEVP